MPDITSMGELLSVMQNGVATALNYVLDKCEDELHNSMASVGIPNNGAGHLWDAWEKIRATISGNTVKALYDYNPSSLILVQTDPWYESVHGSNYARSIGGSSPNDVRGSFEKIIFNGLAPLHPLLGQAGGTQPARDAWTPFISKVESNLKTWIIEGCAMAGLECY